MRVLISVDMEGIAGVSHAGEVFHDGPDYGRFRRLMTEEVNAAVAGAFEAGAAGVVVNDSHNGMRNVMYESLDDRAELISGYNKPLGMMQGVEGASAVIGIGYHAWAGTARAALDHTISSAQIHNLWLNGVLVGESQVNAALCGHYGVPLVMVSGDDKLARQIEETLPGTRAVVVKHALDASVVRTLPRREVYALIRQGVTEAVAALDGIPVKTVKTPVTFRLEFKRSTQAEVAALLPAVTRMEARIIEVTGRDMVEAFRFAKGLMRLASTADVG